MPEAVIVATARSPIGRGRGLSEAVRERGKSIGARCSRMKSQRSPVPTLFLMIILRATLSLFQTILIVRFATIDS